MRITSLTLDSFRSFAGVTLPLDQPRIIVGGLLGAGKSSVREAIRYGLTGDVRTWDNQRIESKDLVPNFNGQGDVSVTLHVEGIGRVARRWTPMGTSFGVEGSDKPWTGGPTIQQAALYTELRTSEPFLHAVLDSNVFLRLHHAEAKALVLALLNVSVTVHGTTYTLDTLEHAYKRAFEDRRVAKARLKGLSTPHKPEGEFPSLEAVDARLKELQTTLEGLLSAIGTTNGKREQLQRRLTSLKSPDFYIGTVPEAVLPNRIEDLEERLAIMEADLQPTDDPATSPIIKPDGEIDVAGLRARAATLEAFKPTKGCVLDPLIPCNTHKLKFANRGKDILASLEQVQASDLPKAPTVNPLTAVRKELESLKAMQASYTHASEEAAKLASERDAVQAELSSLTDTSAQDRQIVDVRERIAKGETVRRGVVGQQGAIRAYEDALTAKREQEADVARLEALVEALGPSGARVPAIAAALGPFNAAINGFLQPWGWTIQFQVEPWQVVVNGRPVETYSRSEQYRIGIAVQLAVAGISGLDFAVVDEFDLLDQTTRDVVGRMIYQSTLGQVLILGTREPSAPLPSIPRVRAYRLANLDQRSTVVETTVGA